MAGHGGKTRTSGQGRPKGAPNKVTTALKDMIRGALEDAGGRDYLKAQAEKNPAAFMTLVGKILPTEVSGPDGGAISVEILRFAEKE